MDIFKRTARIMVLEDDPQWQIIIRKVAIQSGIREVIVVDTIQGFRDRFSPGEFQAVLLDNKVRDGEAIRRGLVEWVRWHDPDILIALTSGANFPVTSAVTVVHLGKDGNKIEQFLCGIVKVSDTRPKESWPQ